MTYWGDACEARHAECGTPMGNWRDRTLETQLQTPLIRCARAARVEDPRQSRRRASRWGQWEWWISSRSSGLAMVVSASSRKNRLCVCVCVCVCVCILCVWIHVCVYVYMCVNICIYSLLLVILSTVSMGVVHGCGFRCVSQRPLAHATELKGGGGS